MRSHRSLTRSARTLNPARHDGMTLIEVLVTLVIMSVGLLGVAALQLTTVRNNYDAFVRSQAAMLASDMLDRMRSNRLQAAGYVAAGFDAAPAAAAGTPAANDVAQWRQTLATQLPSGEGQIAVDANQVVTITIRWSERNNDPTQRQLLFSTSSQI